MTAREKLANRLDEIATAILQTFTESYKISKEFVENSPAVTDLRKFAVELRAEVQEQAAWEQRWIECGKSRRLWVTAYHRLENLLTEEQKQKLPETLGDLREIAEQPAPTFSVTAERVRQLGAELHIADLMTLADELERWEKGRIADGR